MNARIIKESRALLPAFLTSVGVTLAASAFWRGEAALGGGAVLLSLSLTLIGASCIGSEFSSRTMPLLLAQPVPRKTIWNEKMIVLGTALLLSLGAWLLCVNLLTDRVSFDHNHLWDTELIMIGICVGIFSSAPWMALKVRNTLLAGLAAWAFPYMLVLLFVLTAWLVLKEDFVNFDPDPYIPWAAAIYCAFAYWRGYANFHKLQAVEVRHRDVALPGNVEGMLARVLRYILPGYTGAVASLLRKELLLQRPSYIAAFCLVTLAVPESIVLKLHPDPWGVTIGLLMINIVLLVFVVPLITTGLAVAEERNLGVAGWQSVLPAPAWTQWLVKLLVVLGTCAFLGAVLPALMGLAGYKLHLVFDEFRNPAAPFLPPFRELMRMSLFFFSAIAVGVFASSLAATTFRAIMLTLGLLAGGATVVGLLCAFLVWLFEKLQLHPTEPQPHNDWILLFVMAVLCVYLPALLLVAYRNSRSAQIATSTVWLQAGGFFALLAIPTVMVWVIALVN